jgi:hypothetical protein
MTLGINATVRSSMLNAITTAAGGSAILTIYNGTRPATGGTATTALAALTCNATFAPAASGGVLTLNSISSATASATGTTSAASFVMDMDVSTSGSDLNLNSTSIVSGATVSVTSATITAGNP